MLTLSHIVFREAGCLLEEVGAAGSPVNVGSTVASVSDAEPALNQRLCLEVILSGLIEDSAWV